jgi:hypothetical protein
VKIFDSRYSNEMERLINQFIEENPSIYIIDIRLNTSDNILTAYIIYEFNNNDS